MRFEVVEIGPAGMLWKWRIVDQWGQEEKVMAKLQAQPTPRTSARTS
jgi:hypothetical protein